MARESSDSDEYASRGPIFGQEAPQIVLFDTEDVKKSIYDRSYVKLRHAAETSLDKEYDIRLRCIQGWFFRCSWSEKFNFLTEICELATGVYVLEEVLKCVDSIYSKDVIDSFGRDRIDFPYDIVPTDDDRALPIPVLKSVKQDDVFWFLHLDFTSQIEVILKLLQLGGGGLIFSVYKEIDRLYKERKEMNMVLTAVDQIVRDLEQGDQKPRRRTSEKTQEDHDNYTVQKLEQIAKRTGELNEFRKKFGIGESGNERTGNGKKKEAAESVDYIQVLPLWLNRKIMTYMKEKDLTELKRVGKYWTRMIEDAVREKSARSMINAKINRIAGGARGHPDEEDENCDFPRVPVWGQEALLNELKLRKGDLVRIRAENDAAKGRKLGVGVWEETFFEKHRCCVNDVCKLLASSTQNKTIHFYSLRTGARTGNIVSGLPSIVTSVAVHDEGFHVVVGCEDGSLLCVNVRKNERVMSYKSHTGAVIRVHVTDDKLVSASEDRTVRYFDLWSGLCLLCVTVDGSITAAAMLERGGCVAAGTAEGKLVFIDPKKKRIFREVVVHDKDVREIVQDGTVLLTTGSDRSIRVWNRRHFDNEICELRPYLDIRVPSLVTALFSLSNKIYAGCADGRLRLICKLTGATIRVIEVTQKNPITGIYAMQEKDTTKMIMWHESGIEMRTLATRRTGNAKKRETKKKARTEKGTLFGRRIFSVVPASALDFDVKSRPTVKRFKAVDAVDREKVAADRSCTVGRPRGAALECESFTEDAFTVAMQTAMKDVELETFPRIREIDRDSNWLITDLGE